MLGLIIVERKICFCWGASLVLPILQKLYASWERPKSEAFARAKYRSVKPAALQAEFFGADAFGCIDEKCGA